MPKDLEDLLDEYELTQAELAALVGCDPSTVSQWVNAGKCSREAFASLTNLFGEEPRLRIGRGRKIGSMNRTQARTGPRGGGWKLTREQRARISRGLRLTKRGY